MDTQQVTGIQSSGSVGIGEKRAKIGFILGLVSIITLILIITLSTSNSISKLNNQVPNNTVFINSFDVVPGLLIAIFAIIFSSLGLKSSRRKEAITGLVLGILCLIISFSFSQLVFWLISFILPISRPGAGWI